MTLPEFPESRAMPATLLARVMPQTDISGEHCSVGDLRELRSVVKPAAFHYQSSWSEWSFRL